MTLTTNKYPAQWYRKRGDVVALNFAKTVGVDTEFAAVGECLHRDDLARLFESLDLTHYCVLYLFTPTTLAQEATRLGVSR